VARPAPTRAGTPAAEPPARPLPLTARKAAKTPKTARGTRTREAVLVAAMSTFARDGIMSSRVGDIADTAGVAVGTVYTYFDDKKDILAALLEPVFAELYAGSSAPLDGADRVTVLAAALRHYLAVYAANGALMRVLTEAVAVDERFADWWFDIRARFLDRIVRGLAAVQRSGGLRTDFDPLVVGSALGGMVENFAWVWFALGGERRPWTDDPATIDVDAAAAVLTRLWIDALFLDGARVMP